MSRLGPPPLALPPDIAVADAADDVTAILPPSPRVMGRDADIRIKSHNGKYCKVSQIGPGMKRAFIVADKW